jgi:tRNA 2-thiouridine synthesizing protein C
MNDLAEPVAGDRAEAEAPPEQVIKRFLYVNRKAPHGTIYALEVLEMVLVSAMFEQDVHVAFLDDGVFQIKKNQAPARLEMKDFSKTYRAMDGYGIEKVYVERESMEERGLSPDDFVVPVTVVGRAELTEMMESMDVVLSA